MNNSNSIKVGDKVKFHWSVEAMKHIESSESKSGMDFQGATGRVDKVFKNGNVQVTFDHLRNRSNDGKQTHNCHPSTLTII